MPPTSRPEKTAHRAGGIVDAPHMLPRLGLEIEIAQAGGEEAYGVNGLAQVVAGMSEKTRLGKVCFHRLVPRVFQFGGHFGDLGELRVERAREIDIGADETEHADGEDGEHARIEHDHAEDRPAENARIVQDMRKAEQRHGGPEADEAGARQHMLGGDRAERGAAQRQRIDEHEVKLARRRAEGPEPPGDADKSGEGRMGEAVGASFVVIHRTAMRVTPCESGQARGKGAHGGVPDEGPDFPRPDIDEQRHHCGDDADMDEPGLEAQIEEIVELPLLGAARGTKLFDDHAAPPFHHQTHRAIPARAAAACQPRRNSSKLCAQSAAGS